MPLKDILHRHEKDSNRPDSRDSGIAPVSPQAQEFRFIRTDTHTQEVINPSVDDYDEQQEEPQTPQTPRRRSFFRRRSRASSEVSNSSGMHEEKGEKRLSNLLHLDHRHRANSRGSSRSSVNIPADLPQIENDIGGDEQERQAKWEDRATRLVQGNPRLGGGASPDRTPSSSSASYLQAEQGARSRSNSAVSEPQADINIQEAIRLHEAGELEISTHLFGVLADPNGANNALAQVLYGLALRHGWGCEPDLAKAVIYLSAAASNSAMIEEEALHAGMKKGGAAKGELVLAIYELANCFRNGWGVEKDPIAARQYYETAANLGDTDAMNECAWCYLEGFGGKKDKFTAAKYYRLAEDNGNKTLGNSWIWKDKYNPK